MRAILTYHSIDPSGSPVSIDATAFRRQVRWLVSGRVRVVPLSELLRLPPEAEALALTFDDGFENFARIAAPLLREYALPATLFVVAGCAGGTNAWGGHSDPRVPTLPLLDWPALARLAERGISLGAHTMTHPHLTGLDPSRLEDEVAESGRRIEAETGRRPAAFAYPYGAVNETVLTVVARHYEWACTTELRALGAAETPALLPRLDMFYLRDPGRLEAWGTTRFLGRLWLRSRARRLRQALAPAGRSW